MRQTVKNITIKDDFNIAKGNFLDEFYKCKSNEVRIKMIEGKPTQNKLTDAKYTYLSAMVECLCNRYGIEVPEWVFDEVFFMLKEPCFASGIIISVPGYQEYLKEFSPIEFKNRNLYPGNNTLNRY